MSTGPESKPRRHGLFDEGLRQKMLVVYALMFVLPTAYLLFAIHELSGTDGSGAALSPARLGLLVGLPALVALSLGALLLLRDSLGNVRRVASDVESFLKDFETANVPPPEGRDEAKNVAYYVSRMIEEFRRHITAIERYAGELHEANEKLTDLALVDPLTGVYNHKHAMHVLDVEMQRAVRHETPLAVMIVDLDDFKAFCGKCGKVHGDGALRRVGRILVSALRRLDMVARMNEDRFAVLLIETQKADAIRVAERLRQAIAQQPFESGPGGETATVTASIGVTVFTGESKSPEDVLRNAEEHLLMAKHAGKNRVCH
jgi:diguanylate cyclase (GGDEF)-like protein